MDNILKTILIVASLIALPKIVLGLFEFLKWSFGMIILLILPTRGRYAIEVMTKNFKKQTVFNSKNEKDKEKPSG